MSGYALRANPTYGSASRKHVASGSSKGSEPGQSPFHPAEQRSNRRGSPARLSEPEGRVPRRPPVASSAGQSSAKRMTGMAGSPFLPTSLATQRS